MSERKVHCAKLKREALGLEKPPFSGELGEQIFQNVSAEAWQMWQGDMMIKIINEYRLNMADPEQYNLLLDQMRSFLGLAKTETLEVENAARGKGNS